MNHSRTDAHFGSQPDTVITYNNEPVGDAIASLFGRTEALAAGAKAFGLSAYLLSAASGSFGLDCILSSPWSMSMSAIVRAIPKKSVAMDAVIAAYAAWNVVRTPQFGATASYSAISSTGVNTGPAEAADGETYYDFFGQAWEKGSWVAGDWWQVNWSVAQPINRVILYGARQTDGTPLSGGTFGTSGRLTFSDGSTVNWSGWTNNQLPLVIDFSVRSVSWMRVISDAGGGTRPSLAEVEAYDMDQWG